jgi:fatty-acyl-CoA synthase
VELALTPLDFLERARRLFGPLLGVVDGDRRLTYGEFAARCDRLAHALRSRGVQPGDRVAYLCGNTLELLEGYYGVLAAGAILTPLNVRLGPYELQAIVGDCEPTVLIVHPDFAELAGHLPHILRVDVGADYERLLAAQPADRFPADVIDERAPAELFYTSGSTGEPKGVVLTHRSLYLHAVDSAMTMAFSHHDVVLHTIPLFHVNGWGTPHYLTALGGVHVMLRRFDAGEVLRLIDAERVTRLFLVPTMATMVLEHADLNRRDLSSVGQISVGGAPATPGVLQALESAFACDAICGYGMTEAAPQMTKSLNTRAHSALSEPERRAKRSTTGLPNVGVDLRVFDDDDAEVPWDGRTVGEICARSNHIMTGYWNNETATQEALRGGWLRTGDLAVVDAEGYVTIVDRRKDLVISGGENVSTVFVERVLRDHPGVREVAVVGRPDERWGEVPVAFVEPRDTGGAALDAAALRAWCVERLAGFQVPKAFIFLERLPAGGTGKIDKAALRQMVARQLPAESE